MRNLARAEERRGPGGWQPAEAGILDAGRNLYALFTVARFTVKSNDSRPEKEAREETIRTVSLTSRA